MPPLMQVDLPDGRRLLLGGSKGDSGLAEVSARDRVAKATSESFAKGLASLADLAGMLDKAIGALPKRPDTIEMEFRASLTGECDLWIVSGEAEAEFTVKLVWGKG